MIVALPLVCLASAPKLTVDALIDSLTGLTNMEADQPFDGPFVPVPTLPQEFQGSHAGRSLGELVRRGPESLPRLLDRLGDRTPTRIEIHWRLGGHESGPWPYPEERSDRLDEAEMDRRWGTPSDVSESLFRPGYRDQKTLTVGDVCFYAIGRIVNRAYSPAYTQAFAGYFLAAPSLVPKLADAVRREWRGADRKRLLASLTLDVLMPDQYWRTGSAMQHVVAYFPDWTLPLTQTKLAQPFSLSDLPDRYGRLKKHGTLDGAQIASLLHGLLPIRSPELLKVVRELRARLLREPKGFFRDEALKPVDRFLNGQEPEVNSWSAPGDVLCCPLPEPT